LANQWRLRVVCLGLLAVTGLLLAISFATAENGRTCFGTPLGADFAGFYCAGKVLSLPAPDRDRLYDRATNNRLYHQLLPFLPEASQLPYLHPPFVAVGFRYLADLPYAWAFAVWLGITIGLYLGAFALAWKPLAAAGIQDWRTPLLLALAFEPFLMECLLGGQLSAFGCFWIAAALTCQHEKRPLATGLALGFLCYKPTLLVLLLPLLLFARHWRTLAGFMLTGGGLAGLSPVFLWRGQAGRIAGTTPRRS
jgi:hypothetical protein